MASAASRDLPGFVVLQSGPRGPRGGDALWSSGFLPDHLSGRPLFAGRAPILNLPAAGDRHRRQARVRRRGRGDLNQLRLDEVGDPEIATRIAAYEMAYRMQTSAPELMDLSAEPKERSTCTASSPGKPSFATNCLLARRLVERGVRFVQLYHTNWDHHGGPRHWTGIC